MSLCSYQIFLASNWDLYSLENKNQNTLSYKQELQFVHREVHRDKTKTKKPLQSLYSFFPCLLCWAIARLLQSHRGTHRESVALLEEMDTTATFSRASHIKYCALQDKGDCDRDGSPCALEVLLSV